VQETLAEMIGAGADQPLPANHVATPVLRQEVNYSCGDNAALSVLRFWRPDIYDGVTEQDLYGPMKTTPDNGTEPEDIAAYINGVPGLKAEYRTDVPIADVEAAVDRGQPPIVDIQAWQGDTGVANEEPWGASWDNGHFVVLTGYDDVNFYFMDPSTDALPDGTKRYAYIPRSELVDRWHDGAGPQNVHVRRMVIFVSPTDASLVPAPEPSPSPQASIMH
jgi:predicted double-glycine peptidase